MKKSLITLFFLFLISNISCFAAFDKTVEKSLKKQYREVTYMAHSDCYLVMSKKDKDYFGVCNSKGEEIIPPYYKKISFERTEDGKVLMFALNPGPKAETQGNMVYSLQGKIIDMGRNEPQYVAGGYLTSYGKPIYNLNGRMVLDCQQNSVQPMRHGNKIIGYRVSTRSQVNNATKEELLICGPNFNKLFSLEGQGYMWKVEETQSSTGNLEWKCTKSLGANDVWTLTFNEHGQLLSDFKTTDNNSNNRPILADNITRNQTTNNQPVHDSPHSVNSAITLPLPSSPANQITPVEAVDVQKKITSDIDLNLPISGIHSSNTFAVIIANENYMEVEKVKFAINDGESVANYFEKTLGIPKNNIRFIKDATLNNMRKEINWLKQISDVVGKEAKVIFYYSGHGVPDEQSKDAYLMPVDGYHSDMITNLSINQLYDQLGSLDVAQVTIFMDACFSGSQRGDKMLVSARGVKIKSKANEPKGKLIVFSAAQGDETAYPLEEQGHGMFTYYLLKKLKDTAGNVTLGELSESITTEVKKNSLLQNGKLQTPSTSVSALIKDDWENLSL